MLIVSSGAIAVGRRHLGLTGPPLKLEEKQAAAATGQIRLAHAYQEALAKHGITVAQILLTPDDTEERRRHLNARATLDTAAGLGAVPVINENDTVATAEIRFGDNDRLAARVAQMVSADTLVLLSDIDGLYTADPRKDPAAEPHSGGRELTPEIEAMAGGAPAGYSSGGMVTKLAAARIAMARGLPHGDRHGRDGRSRCAAIEDGASRDLVPAARPSRDRAQALDRRHARPLGMLMVDDGAAAALHGGKSLLPAGVVAVEGSFERAMPCVSASRSGGEIGRGLSAYASDEARRIAGHKSGEIAAILGYRGRDEMIHRDDLVLTG